MFEKLSIMKTTVQGKVVSITKSPLLKKDSANRVHVPDGKYLYPIKYDKLDNGTFNVYLKVVLIQNRADLQVQLPLIVLYQLETSFGAVVENYSEDNAALLSILSQLFHASIWMATGIFYSECLSQKIVPSMQSFLTDEQVYSIVKDSLDKHGFQKSS